MRESAALQQADVAAKSTADDVIRTFTESVANGDHSDAPYPHWVLKKCFPDDTIEDILGLPFPAPSLDGVSGKRELHNATRRYFDVENRDKFASVSAVSEAFQDKRITDMIEKTFGTDLSGTYLRIEFAQDTDGFWLEPHTDLGVKSFTMLLYLSDEEGHDNLGTDVYDADKSHVARSPFAPNLAFVFVPGDNTYHGFERRPIKGVRKSLIINYVTDEWRAREQLAFPEAPID
ncbi:2OG-Fe(II) oxygenase [Methyloceanibacter sp. wino2]|uniref:2OG-Fe(II) oxygenase n=1 Tax=Methyloceanibacter sp. wino2 TaxID=2170729 RepID=UPI001FDFD49A|nr:2OG-Fe(II) oxygenase [Methyloceanibacter sp. wino2]